MVAALGLAAFLLLWQSHFTQRKFRESLRAGRAPNYDDPEGWQQSRNMAAFYVVIAAGFLITGAVLIALFPDTGRVIATIFAIVPIVYMLWRILVRPRE